ncbi:MAG: response regulator [Planctomyces sp.]|nr:response regulator [Planctomyces sp.]
MKRKSVLTTGEVARYCSVHFRTVLRWIERGDLNAYKLPGRGDNRIRIEDFLNFLAEHEMPIPAELGEATNNKVLIVEDEPRMARCIQRVLHGKYETVVATDGFRAGAYLKTYQPKVMTLDLQMPGLSGFDVLTFVRATKELCDTRILVLSGMGPDDLAQASLAGADAVMSKPFDNDELLATIDHLMESAPQGAHV